MITITERVRSNIVNKIITKIQAVLFLADVAITKIEQNINIISLKILGKTIDPLKVDLFIDRCTEGYLKRLPRRGELIGTLAGQSLTQPLTQSCLKSQHSAGTKTDSTQSTLVKLNSLKVSPRVISLHLLDQHDIKEWAKSHEYITFQELIISIFGSCKYIPNSNHTRHKNFLYVNVPKLYDVSYIFLIDPFKLRDSNLTPLELFEAVFALENLGLIIHPLQTFKFEICPNGITLSEFDEQIQTLLKSRIKGIKGVESVDVKSLVASDTIKYIYYDTEQDKSFLYCLPDVLIFFPIDELLDRIDCDNEILESTGMPKRLIFKGKVSLSEKPYQYVSMRGSMKFDDVISTQEHRLRMDYVFSNDPIEMLNFLGIISAEMIHEYSYSLSLKANNFNLSYAHINILCSNIFSFNLNPITPQGFTRLEGMTPLDKLSYQNFAEHVSIEPMLMRKKYPVRGLITTTMLGTVYPLGSNYPGTRINQKAKQDTIDQCSIARTEQHYDGLYKGIDFYGVGQIKKIPSGLQRVLLYPEQFDSAF
jgi:hypothetical protein